VSCVFGSPQSGEPVGEILTGTLFAMAARWLDARESDGRGRLPPGCDGKSNDTRASEWASEARSRVETWAVDADVDVNRG
jgi:hypothetical protein